jgi:hypothetical protein
VVGGASGLAAMDKHSTLAESCPAGYCPPPQRSDLDNYHALGAVSTAGFIVGGAGVIASVILFLAQPKFDRVPAQLARRAPQGKPANDEGGAWRPPSSSATDEGGASRPPSSSPTDGLGWMVVPGMLGIHGRF